MTQERTAVVPHPPAGPAVTLVAGTPVTGAAVAVCIPVYQGERFLATTLEAVLAQTWTDVEVVVLDNASTDGTAAVLAAVDDPRVTVWRNAATVPMIENFNRAVALSHAPLVKLLPADDLLEPRCLERQVTPMLADPDLTVVASRAHLVDEHGRIVARSRFLRGLLGSRDHDDVVRRVVRSGANPIGADCAVTFRRSAFLAAGRYRGAEMHADLCAQMRMLEFGRFLGQRETLVRFRVAPTTASAAADAQDYAAQRTWTLELAATEPAVRRRDRWIGALGAPLARRRRELLFRLVTARARLTRRDA